MRKLGYIFVLFLFLLAGCQDNSEGQSRQNEENEVEDKVTEEQVKTETAEEEEMEPQQTEKEMVLEKADEVLLLLKNKNAEELSKFVHSEKGVLFSPYAHIEAGAVTFKREDLTHFFHIEKEYTWGMRDGSGEPITTTPTNYYNEFIYDAGFEKADEIAYNPEEARGNIIKNVKDVFPDSQVVEYYVKGTEEYDNMDWKALNLVFEKDSDGEWKLVAIVHDQWTI